MTDSNSSLPIPAQLIEQLSSLSRQQKACLAGYLWAESQGDGASFAENISGLAVAPKRKITVISASATGNAAGIAKKLTERLQRESLNVNLTNAGNYKARQLPKEDIVVIATSTQGDEEPPEEGVLLHSYLFGKKPQNLRGSVLQSLDLVTRLTPYSARQESILTPSSENLVESAYSTGWIATWTLKFLQTRGLRQSWLSSKK